MGKDNLAPWFLTRPQVALVLAGTRGERTADAAWALARGLVVELDGGLVPLATAEPALIQEFEREVRRPVQGAVRLPLELLVPHEIS